MPPSVILAGLPWDHNTNNFQDTYKLEAIRRGLEEATTTLLAAGYDYEFIPVVPADGAAVLSRALKAKHIDLVIVGFGVRGNPAHTPFLEQLVNAVQEVSPTTKVAFNTTPETTIDAAQRWFPISK